MPIHPSGRGYLLGMASVDEAHSRPENEARMHLLSLLSDVRRFLLCSLQESCTRSVSADIYHALADALCHPCPRTTAADFSSPRLNPYK
jgi:hypothetical protein